MVLEAGKSVQRRSCVIPLHHARVVCRECPSSFRQADPLSGWGARPAHKRRSRLLTLRRRVGAALSEEGLVLPAQALREREETSRRTAQRPSGGGVPPRECRKRPSSFRQMVGWRPSSGGACHSAASRAREVPEMSIVLPAGGFQLHWFSSSRVATVAVPRSDFESDAVERAHHGRRGFSPLSAPSISTVSIDALAFLADNGAGTLGGGQAWTATPGNWCSGDGRTPPGRRLVFIWGIKVTHYPRRVRRRPA